MPDLVNLVTFYNGVMASVDEGRVADVVYLDFCLPGELSLPWVERSVATACPGSSCNCSCEDTYVSGVSGNPMKDSGELLSAGTWSCLDHRCMGLLKEGSKAEGGCGSVLLPSCRWGWEAAPFTGTEVARRVCNGQKVLQTEKE